MPNLVAKAVLTLVAGFFQPTTRPQDAPNLGKLYDTEKGIRQLEQQLEQMNSQLNGIQIKPFLEIPQPRRRRSTGRQSSTSNHLARHSDSTV